MAASLSFFLVITSYDGISFENVAERISYWRSLRDGFDSRSTQVQTCNDMTLQAKIRIKPDIKMAKRAGDDKVKSSAQ